MKKISVSGKYIAKMFSLKKFWVSVFWFVFMRVAGSQGYVSHKCTYSLRNL